MYTIHAICCVRLNELEGSQTYLYGVSELLRAFDDLLPLIRQPISSDEIPTEPEHEDDDEAIAPKPPNMSAEAHEHHTPKPVGGE